MNEEKSEEMSPETSKTSEDVAGERPAPSEIYETRVPAGESPVTCSYCERPLEDETLLILHEGLDHWERLSDEERATFRETYQDETIDLRRFRLKMLGLLVLLYFAFLFVYSYFTANPFAAALLF